MLDNRLADAWSSLVMPKKVGDIKWARFEREKADYLRIFRTRQAPVAGTFPHTFESKLAFIEAAATQQRFTPLNFQHLFAEGSAAQKRKIYKLVNKLDFEKGFVPYQIRNLMNKIYLAEHGYATDLENLSRGVNHAVDEFISERFEWELAAEGMQGAVQLYGLHRDPKYLQKFWTFMDRHSTLLSYVGAVANNLPFFWTGIPTYIPAVDWLGTKEVKAHVRHSLLNKGIQETHRDLRQLAPRRLRLSFRQAWVRKIGHFTAMCFLVNFMLNEYRETLEQESRAAKEELAADRDHLAHVRKQLAELQAFLASPEAVARHLTDILEADLTYDEKTEMEARLILALKGENPDEAYTLERPEVRDALQTALAHRLEEISDKENQIKALELELEDVRARKEKTLKYFAESSRWELVYDTGKAYLINSGIAFRAVTRLRFFQPKKVLVVGGGLTVGTVALIDGKSRRVVQLQALNTRELEVGVKEFKAQRLEQELHIQRLRQNLGR